MIIETFAFTYTRLRYIYIPIDTIPFHPDGKDGAFVMQYLLDGKAALKLALAQDTKTSLMRGRLAGAQKAGHDATVMVHACMKSCYRTDPVSLQTLRRVPTQDETPAETLQRMTKLNAVWAELPNPPGLNGPFTVREMTRASFELLNDALDTRLTEFARESALLDKEEAKLRVLNGRSDDFVTNALIQGRAQFAPGTPERALIDAVPVEPSTQKPDAAVVSLAVSLAAGAARLEFSGAHATSFQVWHKGPGEAEFTQVDNVLLPGKYDAAGLAAGTHLYKIVPENSRGEGPASEVATVEVAAAAVA